LRHDDDETIPSFNSGVEEHPRPQPGSLPELTERYLLLRVLVDPERDESPIRWSRIESLNQVVAWNHTVL
jgi:hypothetical protein